MSLRGQVVVVTGASRGLGRAVALRLVQAQAHVVVAGRDAAALAAVAGELRSSLTIADQQIAVQAADVSVSEDVERLVQVASTITGRLDVLVCNAGIYGPIGR